MRLGSGQQALHLGQPDQEQAWQVYRGEDEAEEVLRATFKPSGLTPSPDGSDYTMDASKPHRHHCTRHAFIYNGELLSQRKR